MFSDKQLYFFKNANHRWNIKSGATRSGKTYCDFFMIPKRIRACKENGLIVLIGTTVSTLCRNILDPMRELWGEYFVEKPTAKDTVMLFGKKCWLIGAGRADQAAKLQGSGIEYAYGDEITTWNEKVFEMLKSRLDKPNSHFDGTCNPSSPDHWFKRFLDSDADIFLQSYTIDDNPFLDANFVRELKKEYQGTVYYDRYILGRWCAAEGIIYRRFADAPLDFAISDDDPRLKLLSKICVGVDFGGNRSGTAFVACGTVGNYDSVCALSSERHLCGIDSDRLGDLFCDFIESVEARYGKVCSVFCDSAEPVLIRSLKKAAFLRGLSVQIKIAAKTSVNDRIRLVCRLMAQGRFFITERCKSLAAALSSALWKQDSFYDERKDDGSTDIDSLDAFEYCIERDIQKLSM
ncbi:MAG: phage terminase large subunit [Clostridia bacterium]|nr:phage terminase large subunit [Clostridia bacterium]